jgi:hypothetical protein
VGHTDPGSEQYAPAVKSVAGAQMLIAEPGNTGLQMSSSEQS